MIAGGGESTSPPCDVRNDFPGGIGPRLRFVDAYFGFLIIEQEAAAGRRLWKAARGTALLAEGGQDPAQGFATGAWLRLRLLAESDRFELAVNETIALAGRDANLGQTGSVGLFCRGNPNARFRHVSLTSL